MVPPQDVPTEEEIAESRCKQLEMVKNTYIENWPQEMVRLSIPHVDILLPLRMAKGLGSNILELGQAFLNTPCKVTRLCLLDALDRAVAQFPEGAFVRLGSRSPKDAFCDKVRVTNGVEAFRRLTACSERIYEDLSMALAGNYEPHIFVRQWIDIPEWAEFRCFMVKHKLRGISQYNYLNQVVYPEVVDQVESIEWAIKKWFPSFVKTAHDNSLVFDVFIKHRKCGNQNSWEVKLLEINPMLNVTDPCLFDWNNPKEFDGRFKFNSC